MQKLISKMNVGNSLHPLCLLFILLFILNLSSYIASQNQVSSNTEQEANKDEGKVRMLIPEDSEMLYDRMKWFLESRLDEQGRLPYNAIVKAIRQEEENIKKGLLKKVPEQIPGNGWIPIGPAPLGSYSGRVTAIAAIDSNTIYIGAASGGVWKTTNAGTSWTSLTDNAESLSVSCITVDPNDSSKKTLYVGTGESNHSCDSYFGAGILKTTDGGNTWTLIGNSVFANTSVSKVIVHPSNPNILWASNTRGNGGFICSQRPGSYSFGVWKSTNGGQTWTKVLGQSQTGVISYTLDLIIDPTDPNILYAGIHNSGVWKTTDGGGSWSKLSALPTSNIGVIDLAIDPTNHLIVYATIEDSSTGQQMGLYKTTNGGTSWTALNKPSSLCSTYCWYCMYVEVSPNGQYLWLGGVSLYRSGDGGSTWTSMSGIHVDQHAMAVLPDGTIWIGNDGGIYRSTNNGSSWSNRNTGIYVTQFYPGASLHPSNANKALAGTQDNASAGYNGSTSWDYYYGGDGAATAFDLQSPDTTFYVSSQYLNIQKTTNGGSSFFTATSGISEDSSNTPFIAQYRICPSNRNILIAGTNNVWKTTNAASSWSSNSPDPIDSSGSLITTLAFAPSVSTCNTYFVGLKNGKIYRTTVGGGSSGWTNISSGLPSRGVNDIDVHPTNANIVYAAFSGFGGPHVYKTTNALDNNPTWTAIDTGIPDIPVNAVLVDPVDPNYVYIGTDIGIYRSTDAGTSWQAFNVNHPRVVVHDLVANASTQTIISFTHGRSAFKLGSVTPPCPSCAAYLPGSASIQSITGGDSDPYMDNCESATISVTIQNIGTSVAQDVLVNITSSNPFYSITTNMPVNIGNIPYGQTKQLSFNVDIGKGTAKASCMQTGVFNISVQATGQSPAAEDSFSFLNEVDMVEGTKTYAFEPSTGLEGWQVQSGTWALSSARVNPGTSTRSLHSSQYSDNQCDVLISPEFEATSSSQLIIPNWYAIEPQGSGYWYDRANVHIITGSTRTLISPSSGKLYQSGNFYDWGTTCNIGAEAGWSGNTTGNSWGNSVFNLSSFAGQKFKAEIRYMTDTATNDEGVYVDDIQLVNVKYQSCDTKPDDCSASTLAGSIKNTLYVNKSAGNPVLSWTAPGGTCNVTAYGIYRGNLPISGNYDHAPVSCNVTNLTYTDPSAPNSYYYLVVPHNEISEGSYGKKFPGNERNPSTSPCKPQNITSSCN